METDNGVVELGGFDLLDWVSCNPGLTAWRLHAALPRFISVESDEMMNALAKLEADKKVVVLHVRHPDGRDIKLYFPKGTAFKPVF